VTTRAVLCDLDDTLFDHRRSTRSALASLHAGEPAFAGWTLDELDRHHRRVLESWHLRVLAGEQTIDQARIGRFAELLTLAGADRAGDRAPALASAYREQYASTWYVVDGALELAAAIHAAHASLVIVTNNMTAEQELKLARCGLDPHVDALVTSEAAGAQKPDAAIFRAALARAGVSAPEAVMLGDAWHTDIVGARNAGIRPVWLNRFGETAVESGVAEIQSLSPTTTVLATLLARP